MDRAGNGHTWCKEHGDVSARDVVGVTALMKAAAAGHIQCVKALVEKGADVNAKSNAGVTALMGAAIAGHIQCVTGLVEKGADVNAKSEWGYTALMWAAEAGHSQCVTALVEKGADVNAKSYSGNTALKLAESKGHTECAEILRKHAQDKQVIKASPVPGGLQREDLETHVTASVGQETSGDSAKLEQTHGAEQQESQKAFNIEECDEATSDTEADSHSVTSTITATSSGGLFSLENIECDVHILPDSLLAEDEDVEIRITQSDKSITGYQSASHMYEFLPHKKQFQKHLMFRFPLCIKHDEAVSSLQVMYCDDTNKDSKKWVKLPLETATGDFSDDFAYFVWDGFGYLFMTHFCELVMVTTEAGAEEEAFPLLACLFADYRPHIKMADIKITYACTDKHNQQAIIEKFGDIIDKQPIWVYLTGSHLRVQIEISNQDDWELLTSSTQDVNRELLQSLCKFPDPPVTRFVLKLKSASSIGVMKIHLQQLFTSGNRSYQPLVWVYNVEPGKDKQVQTSDGEEHERTGAALPVVNVSKEYGGARQKNLPQKSSRLPLPCPRKHMQVSSSSHAMNELGQSLTNVMPTIAASRKDPVQVLQQTVNLVQISNYGQNPNKPLPIEYEDWPNDLDRDFIGYLQAVEKVLNQDPLKLQKLGLFLGIRNMNGFKSDYLLISWYTKHKRNTTKVMHGLDMWLKLRQALIQQDWPEAAEELRVAIEKQLLKDNLPSWKGVLIDGIELGNILYSNRILTSRQMDEVHKKEYDDERVDFIIRNVILQPYFSRSRFNAFKDVIVKYIDNQPEDICSIFRICDSS